jgi:hypothetical protein
MISCKQSTEWVIQKEHDQFSVKQNLQLLSHMAICRFCRVFAHQSSLINKALHKSESQEFSHLTSTEKEELLLFVQNKIK